MTSSKSLTGGTAIWVFMAVEVLTFGMFLMHHASSWRGQEVVYATSQAQLHVGTATIGTILLLIGSWGAYQGALASEHGAPRNASGWFTLTALSGLVFSVVKIADYSHLDGITLSTNGFWFSYLFLTGLHLAHVLLGVGGFAWLAVQAFLGKGTEGEDLLNVQAGAVYWHLVDVVWLQLFPILYLMHP